MGLCIFPTVEARAGSGRPLNRAGVVCLGALFALLIPASAAGQGLTPEREYRIAARYAPVFKQRVHRLHPRRDFMTRYDFDGNWDADDNWENLAKEEFRLPAYVYYAVSETKTHFFIHYVIFHPRDWKGSGFVNGGLQAVKFAGRVLVFPRYLGLETFAAAHENDLEGLLLVVERENPGTVQGRPVLAEVHRHFRFRSYVRAEDAHRFTYRHSNEPKFFVTRGNRPVFYVESRGHGIKTFIELKKNRDQREVEYVYRGVAEEPAITPARTWPEPVGYELLSLYGTLWQQAIRTRRTNTTFTKFQLYSQYELADFFPEGRTRIGTALNGTKRGRFRAIAPWGWHNNKVRGQWFFDPARNIMERYRPLGAFDLEYFSNRYLADSHISPRLVPLDDVPAPSMD